MRARRRRRRRSRFCRRRWIRPYPRLCRRLQRNALMPRALSFQRAQQVRRHGLDRHAPRARQRVQRSQRRAWRPRLFEPKRAEAPPIGFQGFMYGMYAEQQVRRV